MIDPKLLRTNPALVRTICRMRNSPVDVDRLLEVDEAWRHTTAEVSELQHQQKALTGPDTRENAREIKQRISELVLHEKALRNERDSLLAWVPNLLAPDTPDGESDADNVEIETWGEHPEFSFTPETHESLGSRLGILNLERGAAVAGSGFYYWTGDGARLAWALFSFAQALLMKRGFIPMLTPVVARERTLFGTGYLPFFADEIYRLANDDLCLIGTAEQTLVGFHTDDILPAESLPRCYGAFSPCFRTEAGAYGKASRGAFRVHQFHKVEQIVFCHPAMSEHWHEACLRNETELMQSLGIPYRVVRVCRGDLGAPGYKKYDVEGWFAGFGGYRETHSNTNLLDYQTRRLNIRMREGKALRHPHTISATMITDRALLAILENNQQADGTIIIPEVLRGYLAGQERLVPAEEMIKGC